MARFEPSRAVKTLVQKRFQHSCVICGTTDSVDTAHIYEDATERRATPDRLVVLCPNHNQAPQRARGKENPGLPQPLRPTNLLTGARSDFWEGSYQRGYGKARIAAYLNEKQGAYSEAVDCLREAISALRPLRWGDWLAATMLEAERLCLSYTIGIARRWLLLDRVAIALFDYGRGPESAEVLSAAIHLRERITGDSYDPQQLIFDKQGSFRRECLIRGSTGRTDHGDGVNDLLQRLEEEAAELLKLERFDSVVTHFDVARNLAASSGDRDRSHQYSEQALKIRRKSSHKWALIEHFVGEAEYFAYRGDPTRSLDCAGEAMTLFSKYPAVLEPIIETKTIKKLSIHQRLQRLGIGHEELLASGVHVAPDIDEVPLALTKSAVSRIVRNVIENHSGRGS